MKKLTAVLIIIFLSTLKTPIVYAAEYDCGQTYDSTNQNNSCKCSHSESIGPGWRCCGWATKGSSTACLDTDPASTGPTKAPRPTTSSLKVGNEVTAETLDSLNPLRQEGNLADELSTPTDIINRFLSYLFPIAGFILFLMIVWGGFEMMTGALNKKSVESGKQRVTAAVIGFMLLFASYWITQIIEAVFGIQILG